MPGSFVDSTTTEVVWSLGIFAGCKSSGGEVERFQQDLPKAWALIVVMLL